MRERQPARAAAPATGLAAAHSAASTTRQQQAPAHEREHRRQREARRRARTPAARSTRRRRPPPQTTPRPSARPGRTRSSAQPREQRSRGEHRQRRQQPHAEQRGKRREQQAVARQVVSGVPVLVPHREPEVLEQVQAVDRRREIRRVRVDEQPRRQQRRSDRHAHQATPDAVAWWEDRPGSGVLPHRTPVLPSHQRRIVYSLGTGERAGSSCAADPHAKIMTAMTTDDITRFRLRRALRAGVSLIGCSARQSPSSGCATGHPRPIAASALAEARDVPLLPRLLGWTELRRATRWPPPTARRATSARSATASTTATACTAKASSAAAAASCRCRSRP